MIRRLCATVAMVLLAAGCTAEPSKPPVTAPTPGLQEFYDQEPAWRDCDDGFECAVIKVPLDYTKPEGERIDLSMIKLPATGDKIGSLLINPGGPGASGIEFTRSATAVLSAKVRARFDVVGFDPRGVGESTPVRCLTGQQLDAYEGLDPTPDSDSEVTALEQGAEGFAAGCGKKAARLLPFISTRDAARDMDVLRGVLGDPGLTYMGWSYGTLLGATYADLFPKHVRALTLDGAVDPSVTALKANQVQAEGFEVALKAFIEDCFKDGACPFTSRTVDGALAEIDDLLHTVDQNPLKNGLGDGRVINEAWVALGMATPLYDQGSWPVLRQALGAAFKGDGTALLRLADLLLDRDADGAYSNQTEANMAVNCVDSSFPKGTKAFEKAAAEAAKTAPHFGPFIMWGSLPCSYWPAAPVGDDNPLKASGAPPILVIGTLRDPATPYEWAEGLAKQLESGVLLGYDGDGHTAYHRGSTCVDTAVDTYLISLKPPKDNTRCPKV